MHKHSGKLTHVLECFCWIDDSQYYFQLKFLHTSNYVCFIVWWYSLCIPVPDPEMVSFNFFPSGLIHHNSLLRSLGVLSGNTSFLSLSLMSSANLIRLVSALSKIWPCQKTLQVAKLIVQILPPIPFLSGVICNGSHICPQMPEMFSLKSFKSGSETVFYMTAFILTCRVYNERT